MTLRTCLRAGSLKSVPAPQSGTPSSAVVEDVRAVLGLKYPRVDVGQDHGQLQPRGPCASPVLGCLQFHRRGQGVRLPGSAFPGPPPSPAILGCLLGSWGSSLS